MNDTQAGGRRQQRQCEAQGMGTPRLLTQCNEAGKVTLSRIYHQSKGMQWLVSGPAEG